MSEQKIHVLYISYDGMTDFLGQSQVLPYLIGLSKKGYLFHLISFEKQDRFLQFKDEIQELCDMNSIVWHPIRYTKKPPLLSTIYDVWRMKRRAIKLHKQHAFSIVHCRSYLSALVGLKMKRNFGVKFIFDMRGFWADERVDGGLWNLKNPLYKLVYSYFKKKENQFLIESDATVSLTIAGKDEMQNWDDFSLFSPIHIIPCCADLQLFKPYDAISSSNFTIGYLGSIGTWYMLEDMLSFFKQIKDIQPTATFHFLTKDAWQDIHSAAEKIGLTKEDFIIEEAKRMDIPKKTANWDYSIFFIKPSFSKISSSPTKLGELMGLGIPVICNKGVGDVEYTVNKYQSGFVLDINEVDKMDVKDLFIRQFDKNNIRKGAEEYYSLEKGIEMYQQIYKSLL